MDDQSMLPGRRSEAGMPCAKPGTDGTEYCASRASSSPRSISIPAHVAMAKVSPGIASAPACNC